MKILVINRQNNMGDTMNQMAVLKEYKESRPEIELDFVSCYPLHWLMAYRTDLFNKVDFVNTVEELEDRWNRYQELGYEERIEFVVDFWDQAAKIGILKAFGVKTLNFEAKTNRPYFLTNDEDKVIAKKDYLAIAGGFRKTVIMQLQAPSDALRSFRQEDFEKVLDLFPADVGVIYPTAINAPRDIFPIRANFIFLPGYPIGYTAEMMKLSDLIFAVHGGIMLLAYAVEAKPILHIMFEEACPAGILQIYSEDGENVSIPNNREINWEMLQTLISKYV